MSKITIQGDFMTSFYLNIQSEYTLSSEQQYSCFYIFQNRFLINMDIFTSIINII